MSYETTRISEQIRVLDPAIDDFIDRYNASTGSAAPGARQTVFFFPGGMASRLVRAEDEFDPKGPPNQVFDYDDIWLTVFSFLGEAADLRMKKVGPNQYHDKDKRVIVADGIVSFFGIRPYRGFIEWCEDNELDYFVFPWDWRRAVYDVGDLFITHFLPYFQARVIAGCNGADPLQRFSLIGHSAGGMVVNWAMRSGAPIMAGLDNVITVATPFYGYSGQLHRWFEGEEYLNGFGLFTEGVIRAICSFPGCYEWMFLPDDLYLVEQAALANDAEYPLNAYPSADLTTAVIADPYNPQTKGALQRYPSFTKFGFDYIELASAKAVVIFLASPLSQGEADRFWNIRADTNAGDTLNETTWNWVPPTDPTPIQDSSVFRGDGVQPAWTARHIHLEELAPGHVISIRSKFASHKDLMDLPATLQEIAGILGIPF